MFYSVKAVECSRWLAPSAMLVIGVRAHPAPALRLHGFLSCTTTYVHVAAAARRAAFAHSPCFSCLPRHTQNCCRPPPVCRQALKPEIALRPDSDTSTALLPTPRRRMPTLIEPSVICLVRRASNFVHNCHGLAVALGHERRRCERRG